MLDKPSSYEQVYHCRDCEFMWALGGCENVCTVGMISDLPIHPHDAIDFKSNDEIYAYDARVRELANDDCLVDPFSGSCDVITLRNVLDHRNI
jgi:hypothetical protein